jgi:uncharacterized protein (TIGR03067 family)
LWSWCRSLWNGLGRFWRWLRDGSGFGVDELARRLGLPVEQLRDFRPSYQERRIPKRSGGERVLAIPTDELKALQRRLLRRLFKRLRCHPAARGFQPGESIVTNALPHANRAVVVRLDLKDFFPSTSAARLYRYFRRIGWNRPAARLLLRLCTHQDGLPQGAPTSPRLSNLVNYRLDRRLTGMANKLGARYTRYADDITFSFAVDDRDRIRYLLRFVRRAAAAEGYRLHARKKLHIRRQHQQQRVTGLVVNAGVHLPRRTRRWLRAVEHRLRTGRPATLNPQQLAGWRALCDMISRQGGAAGGRSALPGTPSSPLLFGNWVVLAVERDGQSLPCDAPREGIDPVVWTFGPDELRIVQGRREERTAYTLDGSTEPPSITMTPTDGPGAGLSVNGIYRREGDRLTICLAESGRARPQTFTAEPGSGQTVVRLRAAEIGMKEKE